MCTFEGVNKTTIFSMCANACNLGVDEGGWSLSAAAHRRCNCVARVAVASIASTGVRSVVGAASRQCLSFYTAAQTLISLSDDRKVLLLPSLLGNTPMWINKSRRDNEFASLALVWSRTTSLRMKQSYGQRRKTYACRASRQLRYMCARPRGFMLLRLLRMLLVTSCGGMCEIKWRSVSAHLAARISSNRGASK